MDIRADVEGGEVKQTEAIEVLRRQPWILSALLKPFFGREIEHSWPTGRTLHLSTSMLSAEKTRPLRQRALLLAERFICLGERAMVSALLPVIREAIHSIFPKFGEKPTPEMQAAWLPDRLEALKVLERALEAHRNSPFILLQLRPILQNRCAYDPDRTVREECRRLLAGMPDSFEFRVARVLTSWVHDEFGTDSDSTSELARKAAQDKWTAFCQGVARETVERF